MCKVQRGKEEKRKRGRENERMREKEKREGEERRRREKEKREGEERKRREKEKRGREEERKRKRKRTRKRKRMDDSYLVSHISQFAYCLENLTGCLSMHVSNHHLVRGVRSSA
jgi:alpha-galactosidase/6-phospho-beta-glucosidase family protein